MTTILSTLLKLGTDEGFTDVLTNPKGPATLVFGLAAIPAMIVVVKWMVNFQREFAKFYIDENKKLRDRLDSLELEGENKDLVIIDLKTEVGSLKNQVASHERTIAHLEYIINRRKKED